jgi:hypothetical protein
MVRRVNVQLVAESGTELRLDESIGFSENVCVRITPKD